MTTNLSPIENDPHQVGERTDLPASGRVFHSLDELAALDLVVLEQLYRNGQLPDPDELRGALDGRLLGFRGPLLPLDRLLRPLVAQSWFPWQGKAFGDFAANGEGINRLKLIGEKRAFPFDLRVDASILDGRPCVVIDYNRPDNPAPIRPVRDELRSLGVAGEGLFLGPSLWRGRKPRLLLFFGVSASRLH